MNKAILLPILLFVFIGLIIVIAKSLRPKLNNLINWKSNLYLAVGYLVLLLLLVPISTYLAQGDSLEANKDKNKLLAKAPSDWMTNRLDYQFPPAGNFDKTGVYKNSSQKFKLASKALTFTGLPNAEYNQVFIERKDIDDNEVEVDTYVASHFADDIDFTRLIAPPRIILENGNISIQNANKQKLDFLRFRPDFTLSQFLPVKENDRKTSSTRFGWKAVYLRIPKSLEVVNGESYSVTMIQK